MQFNAITTHCANHESFQTGFKYPLKYIHKKLIVGFLFLPSKCPYLAQMYTSLYSMAIILDNALRNDSHHNIISSKSSPFVFHARSFFLLALNHRYQQSVTRLPSECRHMEWERGCSPFFHLRKTKKMMRIAPKKSSVLHVHCWM